jgi:hypothetical protein
MYFSTFDFKVFAESGEDKQKQEQEPLTITTKVLGSEKRTELWQDSIRIWTPGQGPILNKVTGIPGHLNRILFMIGSNKIL